MVAAARGKIAEPVAEPCGSVPGRHQPLNRTFAQKKKGSGIHIVEKSLVLADGAPKIPGVSKAVTLTEIAEKAGVHHSTVSLSLKDSPRISAATKERVLRIAAELGYHPHPYVSTLMHARRRGKISSGTPPLAFVHIQQSGLRWEDWIPEVSHCLARAKQQAAARGFRLEEFSTTIDEAPRLGEILYARGIRGVILGPSRQAVRTLTWKWERLAVVALGPSLLEPGLHRIRHHHYHGMLTALAECSRLGYRRMGIALKEAVSRKTEHRWLAPYLLKQHEARLPDPPAPLLARSWTRETFLSWLEKTRPDVIIGGKEDIPGWLADAGYAIPGDIGLVALNASFNDRHTGINQSWATQGERAVTLLIALLRDNHLGLQKFPHNLLVTGEWNPGETVRRQSGAAATAPDRRRSVSQGLTARVPAKPPSLKDVAAKARVHPSTASLCLSGSPLVAETTRSRVQEIARSMGYRPHPHLRALMRNRRHGRGPDRPPAIAFVGPAPQQVRVPARAAGLAKCLAGARRRAEATGFRLEVIENTFQSPDVLVQRIQAGGFSGIVFGPHQKRIGSFFRQISSLAMVAIGAESGEEGIHRVRANHFKAVLLAVEMCKTLGRRGIGFALSSESGRQSDGRWLAACLACQRERRSASLPGLLSGDNWRKPVFLDWIDRTRPEVVISDRVDQVRRWLKSAGWRVPADIGLVSLSVPDGGWEETGICENWDLQGERAITMLSDLLLEDEQEPGRTANISVIDGFWNPGKTLQE